MQTRKLKFPSWASNGTQARILTTVRDYMPISRTRIAELAGLPHAAISRSTAKLMEKKFITEDPLTDTTGPRRKRGVRLNKDAGHVVSILYDSEGLEGVIVDASYSEILKDSRNIPLGPMSRDEKIEHIVAFAETLKSRASHFNSPCLGLAIVDPGLVDIQAGKAIWTTTMEDWRDVPIVEILEKRMNMPVMLANSLHSMVRAVDQIEVEGNIRNLIYIEYGNGIGCGLKLEGHYIRGESNIAGEMGHLRVTDQPVNCKCGSFGCLEAVAALPALARNASSALTENSYSSLSGKDKITGIDVMFAASQGDRLAIRIVEDAFEYLCMGIVGLVNILDPQVVVIGNRITKAGPEILDRFMLSLKRNISTLHSDNIRFQISQLTSHIGAMGGAASVLDRCIRVF